MRHVVWFSCGAASAVAAKLAVKKYDDALLLLTRWIDLLLLFLPPGEPQGKFP